MSVFYLVWEREREKEMYLEMPSRRHTSDVVEEIDPNDKTGSQGTGVAMYLSTGEPLRYAVFFENLETATAPAQEVVITDQLDPESVDLRTLSLGPIAFGDKLVTPPPGLSRVSTMVDLRPDNDLIVEVDVELDENTGVLTWTLTALDPLTGELPTEPLAGFLPPNVNPPEGQGSVVFAVEPKEGLATGTEVVNDASIVFGLNAPIVTPGWFNTLDNSDPESHVLPLAATQDSADFPVHWTGTDEGAGVGDFTVYVSEDGGPFEVWLRNTPSDSDRFPGEDGRSYAFYSTARDLTGNVEDKAPTVEATTVVTLAPDDRDGDGIADDEDACPDSILTETVVIDQCDSGVPNTVIGDGCSISDRIAEWAASARNHGQFVRQVTMVTNGLQRGGTITGAQSGAIQRCAAQANLP